jgi:predicted nuclease of predicted toxin-antitoxin system
VRFLLDNDAPDVVARVLVELVEAGHEVFLLRNVLPQKSVDSAVLDYATANALVLITCNRDDFIPPASTRAHSGLIILIRRRSRILECAKLLRLLESAGDSGLAGNINFA